MRLYGVTTVARKIGSRYSIDRVIGRGTCGTVWVGAGPQGPVAVKLLREDLAADQTLIARFVQERTVLTSLVHPNIVAIRDLVVDGADLALIMDLVEGEDLRGYLDREQSLRPGEAAALAGDVAAALAAAHARGVVHRDVKPENVLLDESGGNVGGNGARNIGGAGPRTARLTDFGIARLVDGPRRTRATRIVGTPDYLAPEVIEGCLPGPAVDVYALGTVLFELLTGWTPFGGGHPGAVLRRHVTEPVPDVPGMPEPLAELLSSCLSKAPAARLTAAEVTGRLRTLAPQLAGLPALRVSDPRGVSSGGLDGDDPAFGRPAKVGALPLVRAVIEDEGKQTHVNLIRPIKEPLGPSAPIPRTAPFAPGESAAAGAGQGEPRSAGLGGLPSLGGLIGQRGSKRSPADPSARSNRIAAVAAVLAAGLVVAGGVLWWQSVHGVRGSAAGPQSGAVSSAAAAAGAPIGKTTPAGAGAGAAAGPVGPLGLTRLATAPAAPAKPLGAVAYTSAGPATAVLAATGADGVIRVAVAVPGRPFNAWQSLPGVVSAAGPSLVGQSSNQNGGQVELFAVTSGGQVERAAYLSGSWTPWAEVSPAGADGERFAGNPAAVALPGGRTLLLAVSTSGQLWSTTGTEQADGSAVWQDWRAVSAAGPVKPGLAAAAAPNGAVAAFVTRASDAAVLRVVDDGDWEPAWPTGAVGQPAAAYTAAGQPYLFVQEITGDIQVFEPSGADLHGTMSWVTAGVTTQNPPGVADCASAIAITTVAADGTVGVYTTAG
jgi:serine/threonine protein kinase